MAAIHHPAEPTMTAAELEASLTRIDAALDRFDQRRAEIDRQYIEESAADYQRHLARIFAPAWDEERPDPRDYYDDPDDCPACGGSGEFEDEEGFFSDCKTCRPENEEPWIVPCRNDGTPY